MNVTQIANMPSVHCPSTLCSSSQGGAPTLLLLLLFFAPIRHVKGATFTDWTNVNVGASIAQGKLGEVSVMIAGGLADGGVTDGSSTVFDAEYFNPRLAKSDLIWIRALPGIQRYMIKFGAPIEDPIIHLYCMGSVLLFGVPSCTKVGGESNFIVSQSTVVGISLETGGHDSNGSIRLDGLFSAVAFDISCPLFSSDGIGLQVGGTPAAASLMTVVGYPAVELVLPTEPNKEYQILFSTQLPATSWTSIGSTILGDGTEMSIFDGTRQAERRFYRALVK